MKKHQSIQNKKLQLDKIKIYSLTHHEMRAINGGYAPEIFGEPVKATVRKTISNYTCGSGIDGCGSAGCNY